MACCGPSPSPSRATMSSYVEDALVPGERILHQGRLSLWAMSGTLLLGLLLLPVFGLGLVFWIQAWIKRRTTELAITNKRLIVKTGLISRHTVELNIRKVESLQVTQSLAGRMFNHGTLVIAGAGDPQAPLVGIDDPMAFRRAFIEAQDGPPEGRAVAPAA